MTARADTADYRQLFLADTPMMDVRAPVEFAAGAFPGTVSLPLMTDEERAKVGTCYKQAGQAAAIELGHALVSGDTKAERVAAWKSFAQSHPTGYLYCFRGGLRSRTVQQWLHEAGVDYPLVTGGYKAMRRFLIDELARSLERTGIVLIGGRTGVGKTRVIDRLSHAVDLEGAANHRGSAFGHLVEPQPSQVDFENRITIALMKLVAGGCSQVYLEDEGQLIGRLSLPEALRRQMAQASLAIVDEPLESRVQAVLEDYIEDLGARFYKHFGDSGPQHHRQRLQSDLLRIRKRLGGAMQQSLSVIMDDAFDAQEASGDTEGHRYWIRALLADYYDPMYDYQLSKREGRRLFTGTRDEVVEWVRARPI